MLVEYMSYDPFLRSSGAQSSGRFNTNQTGSTIPQGTPVKITSSGLGLVDVSVEADIDAFAGILKSATTNLSNGNVITSGSIENFSTAFAVGSMVYISKIGTLTNVKPSSGVNGFAEGDFVIKIGMIAKNNDNPLNKDLLVGIQVMGQL
jgi:hypothetical protein